MNKNSILKQKTINPENPDKNNYFNNFEKTLKRAEKENLEDKFLRQSKAADQKFANF